MRLKTAAIWRSEVAERGVKPPVSFGHIVGSPTAKTAVSKPSLSCGDRVFESVFLQR
jgi:hypothetical protein